MQPGLAAADDGQVREPVTPERLAAAVGGDELAFGMVYRAVQPGLLRYLRVAVGGEAPDVAADVWLEVARDIRAFSGNPGQFRSWVFTIGRLRAIDHGRRQARRPADLVADVPDRPGSDDTAGAVLDTLGTSAALALIRRLPTDQAEAVMLRAVVGFSVADAARILGKRPGAVRVNTMRGLRGLAALLAEESDGPPAEVGVPTARERLPRAAPRPSDHRA